MTGLGAPSLLGHHRLLVILAPVLLWAAHSAACRPLAADQDGDPPDSQLDPSSEPHPSSPPVPLAPACLQAPGSFAELAGRLAPNIVTLLGEAPEGPSSGPRSALPLGLQEPSAALPIEQESSLTPLGTGFLLDANTQVITSHRAIGHASELTVQLHDGRRVQASVRGSDEELDLALLILEEAPADALALADASHLRPGDWVAILSAPFGSEVSVTVGVLRFLSSRLSLPAPLHRFHGVDAVIDAANWGGPAVDSTGRLVGLAVAAPRAGSQIGLTLPTPRLRRSVSQLAQQGHPARTWLGLWVRSLDEERSRELGLESALGLLVTRIAPQSPAQEAGLEPDDVILEFAGERVTSPGDLSSLSSRAGSTEALPLLIVRAGRQRTLSLRPSAMPQ